MNAEHEFMTLRALARAACSPFITEEDLHILCYHAGKRLTDIQGLKVTGYSFAEQVKAKKELARLSELAREAAEMRDEA